MIQSREYRGYLKCFFTHLLSYQQGLTFIFLLIFLTGLFPSSVHAQKNTMKVAVAANLLLPMQEVKKLYEKTFGSELILIPGSSGKLTAQIMHGAPYDVFLSADMKYPCQIFKEGHAVKEPEALLQGRLVFWSKTKPGTPLAKWLSESNIKSLAIAQPELAPYGQSAKNWLTEKNMYEQLSSKVVFGESIGQVNQYIRSGTVDAAFTAISSMQAEEMKGIGYWQPLTISGSNPSQLDHGIVHLRNAAAGEATIRQFLEFIRSPAVDQVFRDFGYEVLD